MKFMPSLTGTMSGSMGGTTAAHNRGGMYFRNRVVPTNPATNKQVGVRSALAGLVNQWGLVLTAAQRAGWATWAANTPTTDVLGQTLILTGQQAFLRANVPRVQVGLSVVVAPPTLYNNGEDIVAVRPIVNPINDQIGILAGAMNTEFIFSGLATDDAVLLVQLGRPVGPGVTFYKGPFQNIATNGINTPIAVNATDPGVNWTDTIADLSVDVAPSLAQRRALRARLSFADGRLSAPFTRMVEVINDI